ncbi:hypothetical protein OsccyDRAFT_0719 [Leptolyngbyaceae cyanobacterium JSC-12]|nr:hypothetical protein OsccyDRAFT_0719 [Leptolyngbyaceae cyanobacterium JSC-12]
MSCLLVAIDPGKSGGIAFLQLNSDNTYTYEAMVMPIAGKELDLPTITQLLKDHQPQKAIVEQVQAMSKNGIPQGVVSSFSFGVIYGKLLGVLAGLGTPTELVRPQIWKGEVLKGTKKDKDAAIDYCRRVFPSVSLIPPRCRTPHDGIADALCILEYGRRILINNPN